MPHLREAPVSWSFLIPGKPPSWNHSYKIVRYKQNGTSRLGYAKVAGLEDWQTSVGLIVRTSKPNGWQPDAQVRLQYNFYLPRKMDADNALKSLNDAIAAALDIDDDRFLPCVLSKEIDKANPRIVVTVE